MFQNHTQQFAQPVQQLPYNPQAPQWQSVQININNLPVNLSVLQSQVHSNLIQYLPSIAVAVIDTVQSRAPQNPLRMFLYNQLADGQYNNQPFLSLMKTVCDIAEYYAANGMNIEQAITSAIDLSVQFFAFSNLRSYPMLQQYLDQNTMNNLQSLEQKQNQLAMQIQGYMQQKAARNNQGYNQGNQGYPQQQAPFGQVSQPFNGFAPNTPAQQGSWSKPPSGMFASTQAPVDNNATQMVNSWDSNTANQSWRKSEPVAPMPMAPVQAPAAFSFNQPIEPVQEPVVQYAKTYNHDNKTMVKQGDPGVVWKPSERWPVNISASYIADVYYVLHDDGSMEPIIKKLTKEEKMEKLKHMNVLAGHTDKAWGNILKDGHVERVLALEARGKINIVKHEQIRRSDQTLQESDVVKNNEPLLISSEQEGLTQAYIDMNTLDDNTHCEGYSRPAIKVTPIISDTKVSDLVDALGESVSLEQCASKLNVESHDIMALTDEKKKRQRLIVYGKLNRILTNSVNHYLKFRLGLPSVKIDSFDTDAKDLIKYLQDKYPPNYSATMLKHQQNIIGNVLTTTREGYISDDFHQCVKDQLMPMDRQWGKTEPVFLYTQEVYACVDEFSADLTLLLDDEKEVLSVYEDTQPLVHSLCSILVGKDVDDVFTYYLRTVDDVVYEFHRSALSPDVYLISIKN